MIVVVSIIVIFGNFILQYNIYEINIYFVKEISELGREPCLFFTGLSRLLRLKKYNIYDIIKFFNINYKCFILSI